MEECPYINSNLMLSVSVNRKKKKKKREEETTSPDANSFTNGSFKVLF